MHLMDWDFASHLSSAWQVWLLVPHTMHQSRFASAGEPQIALFNVDPVVEDDNRADRIAGLGASFTAFYAFASSEFQIATAARAAASALRLRIRS